MRKFDPIQGFIDFGFFQSFFQFYGEVWGYPPRLEPLMKLIQNNNWHEAKKEFKTLLKEGPGFLKQIDGAFIVVYFERKERTGLIYRSLLCKYSLYLRRTRRQIFWSTRIEQVLGEDRPYLSKVKKEELVGSCFAEVQEPSQTYFRDIKKLPAGHMIRVHRENEEMTLFDQLRPRPDYAKLKWDQAADLVIEILTQTIQDRIEPADRVGVLLSGGIDSSAILMMLKSCQIPVVAYHWGWRGEKSKVRFSAEKVTRLANVPLIILEPGDLKALTKDANQFYLPYPGLDYLMIKEARRQSQKDGINLLASGYFGDYIFGYDGTGRFSKRIWNKTLSRRLMEKLGMLRPTWANHPEDIPIPLFFTDKAAKEAKNYLGSLKEKTSARQAMGYSLNRDKESLIQLHQLSPHQMNMLFPFVSRKLMEIAISLPSEMKVLFRGGQWIEKPVLRQAFFDWLPGEVIAYVPRQYRVLPMEARFLLKHREQVKELLDEDSILADWGIIHCERLKECLEHQRLLMLSTKGLIWAFMTEIWLRSLL
ncbi:MULTISPECIES: asparagine synthase-related protein [Thermoactinomyces]|uniref:asparagine synthase-related protein n=2 Tax=Thermoactinomycetaceae TaxID=186824 RepID=UPI00067396AA|nr:MULTISPECIES: asparagine synthase-related protein [Thermoactinomyces]MBH8584042.1 asparagine synthetase B family protein [Thermoactinomyces sp. CICC 10735]MBH8585431.1 asparagine synthetase B family protein [Thermoactinomyces sp. CICC 10520]MBI0390538.1 asparagine synthetase B family protein [Thermoactinomyces sp. CICC 24226]QBK12420.1 asparagine synthetase B family protein [Thermoactinomyces vulgaris]